MALLRARIQTLEAQLASALAAPCEVAPKRDPHDEQVARLLCLAAQRQHSCAAAPPSPAAVVRLYEPLPVNGTLLALFA